MFDGKFTIDSDFNVWDDWHNFMGKYTPAGMGAENGCLFIITLIIFGLLVYAAYLLYRLTVAGFKALFNGEWLKAIAFLSPLWVTAIVITFTFVAASAATLPGLIVAGQERQKQTDQLNQVQSHLPVADQAEGTLVVNTIYGDVVFERLKGVVTENDIRSCRGYAVDECDAYFKTNRGFWPFKVTIPDTYGMRLGEYTISNFPDRFFGARVNGNTSPSGCFVESWDGGYFEPEVYPNTSPAMMYCEAKADNTTAFDFTLSNPTDTRNGIAEFKMILDPYTGLLKLTK